MFVFYSIAFDLSLVVGLRVLRKTPSWLYWLVTMISLLASVALWQTKRQRTRVASANIEDVAWHKNAIDSVQEITTIAWSVASWEGELKYN